MWATLAIASALSLAANDTTLKLTNPRATYGVLGGVRTDMKFLPGDIFYLAFDMEGLTLDKKGAIQYEMGMEVKDSKGAVIYKLKPQPKEIVNSLGGTTMPNFVYAKSGLNDVPGEYTMKVTVTDLTSKQTATLERKFTIVKKDLGLVRLNLTYDARMNLDAPVVLVPGQRVYLNYSVVGFKVDDKKRPDLTVKVTILDDKGKPTLKEPLTGEWKDPVGQGLPLQAIIEVNRPGKFKIVLEATDGHAKKTATESFHFTVLEPPTAKDR
jgi:hypothetical protein